MKKCIYFGLLTSIIALGDTNVDNSNGTIINNGKMINIQQNKQMELEKSEFDLRITKLANKMMNGSIGNEYTNILEGAKKANSFNIPKEEKLNKCVEYSLEISFIKIGIKFAREECGKIFY